MEWVKLILKKVKKNIVLSLTKNDYEFETCKIYVGIYKLKIIISMVLYIFNKSG